MGKKTKKRCKRSKKSKKKPVPIVPAPAPSGYVVLFGAFEDFEAGQKWFLLPGGNALQSTVSQVSGPGTPTYDYEHVAMTATTKIDFSINMITSFPPVQGGQPETPVIVDIDFLRNEAVALTVPAVASPTVVSTNLGFPVAANDRIAVRIGFNAANVNFPDTSMVVAVRFS
jgi:hypothetical protein